MDLKPHLIAEKERLLEAVSRIDALLESLSRNSVEITVDGVPYGLWPITRTPEPVAIAYMEEAKAFVANWPKDLSFKISDFATYLAKKFGPENVNDQSMRGPIPRLQKEGLIYISRAGGGKVPHLYRVHQPDSPRKVFGETQPSPPRKATYRPLNSSVELALEA